MARYNTYLHHFGISLMFYNCNFRTFESCNLLTCENYNCVYYLICVSNLPRLWLQSCKIGCQALSLIKMPTTRLFIISSVSTYLTDSFHVVWEIFISFDIDSVMNFCHFQRWCSGILRIFIQFQNWFIIIYCFLFYIDRKKSKILLA